MSPRISQWMRALSTLALLYSSGAAAASREPQASVVVRAPRGASAVEFSDSHALERADQEAATSHAAQRSAHLQRLLPPQLQTLRPAVPDAGPFRPTADPSLDGSRVEYLILTSDAMAPEFEPLALWKTAKGVPTVVRTLSEVRATGMQGSDLAETLRMYIQRAFLYWGVRFVLLGGDTDVIPARVVKASFLGLSNPPSEMYYSCLDGDWNANGNADFGEAYVNPADPGDGADFVSDVYLGRAPVSTVQEARLFVSKTLDYENPRVGGFADRVLMLSEVLFPADYRPGDPIIDNGARYAEFIRENFIPACMSVTRLYETSEFFPGSSPLTLARTTSELNSGYGTVLHIGHGYRYTLSVGDGSLTATDAAHFTNGKRAGLFYMLNCTATAFDFESFAEALLLNPNGGATCVLGSAREAFPLAAGDYEYAFFNHLYPLGQRSVGEAMTRSREEFAGQTATESVDRWTQLCYTLLGDPETPLWGCSPTLLSLQNLPDSLVAGGQTLVLQVRDANGPLAGALVCAAKPGEEYRNGRTDPSGRVELRVEPRSAGSLRLFVTAPDHLPGVYDVRVFVPQRALVVSTLGLVDDGAGRGAGNSDGRFDAGETVSLRLALRNAATSPVTQLSATLVSTDPAVTVLRASSNYADLAAGAQGVPLTPFIVRALPGTPDGRLASLELRLAEGASSETRRVELLVRASDLKLASMRLDDLRAGNGNGVQEAGEVVDLYYTLENQGGGTAQGVQLALSAPDPGLELLQASASVPDVAPGASAETVARLTVRAADISMPHPCTLTVTHLQDPTGTSRRLDLRVPAAPTALRFGAADRVDEVHLEWTRPADADLLGYRVYRASGAAGPFSLATPDLLRPSYFRDSGLRASTRYFYRVAAVDSSLVEGPPGPTGSASTNPPAAAGWPLPTSDNSSSSIAVGDVDGDGKPDVVVGARQIFAWDGKGVELYDADHSASTWGLLYGSYEGFSSITLANLDRRRGMEIVAATWDPAARYVVAMDAQGRPLPGWPQPMLPCPANYKGVQVAPVVANLDGTGTPEILVAARDGKLYAWHTDGTEVVDGDGNPATQGVFLDTQSPFLRSAPAVADLDTTRAGLEVVIGGTNGKLYALDARGQALAGWPRTAWGSNATSFGATFASGICVADLNRDGRSEIVVLDGSGRLHAMHLDGSELPGFPVEGIRAVSGSNVPSPAIADLVGDAKLEIVATSSDGKIQIYDSSGQGVIPGGPIDTGRACESSPILGDVDGDGQVDLVLGNEDGIVFAWNLDGSPVAGFPISTRAEVRCTPTLADVDGDGNTDLALLGWDGVVRIWNLGVPYDPLRNPWPTYRGNVNRTGTYGYQVPTAVAVADLRYDVLPPHQVRLRWRATSDRPSAQVVWRIHRAGPFDTDPLAAGTGLPYNGDPIGEIRGTGDLEFVDPEVEPGSWYVYILLGSQELRPGEGGQTVAGSIAVHASPPPRALRILPNVPNPFNPGTRLRFEVPPRAGASPVEVDLALYDARGHRVRSLVRGRLLPGAYTADWDGRDEAGAAAASGTYVVRLRAAGVETSRKVTLVR